MTRPDRAEGGTPRPKGYAFDGEGTYAVPPGFRGEYVAWDDYEKLARELAAVRVLLWRWVRHAEDESDAPDEQNPYQDTLVALKEPKP